MRVNKYMGVRVKLADIADALDVQNNDIVHYLDRQTGEIEMVTSEELTAAERGAAIEEYPEWQRAQIKLAAAIFEDETGRYVELPTQFDLDEYAIMEKFSRSHPDPEISDELCYAIRGRGAFQRFKTKMHQYNIAEAWHKHRDNAIEEIARAWCEENEISCI
jgi:hypothetical protein